MLRPPRILLVDSDGMFRHMVRDFIRRHYPYVLVGEACSAEDALRQVRCFSPDLILTEIEMSGRRILELPGKIRAMHPECAIAVLTSYDLPEYHRAATRAGAHHFISKSMPTGPAILAVVEKELNIPEPILSHPNGDTDDAIESMSAVDPPPDAIRPGRERPAKDPDRSRPGTKADSSRSRR